MPFGYSQGAYARQQSGSNPDTVSHQQLTQGGVSSPVMNDSRSLWTRLMDYFKTEDKPRPGVAAPNQVDDWAYYGVAAPQFVDPWNGNEWWPKSPPTNFDMPKQPNRPGSGGQPLPDMNDAKTIEELRALVGDYAKSPTQVDLTPLMALADKWWGGDRAKSYRPPETANEKKAKVIQLNTAIANREMEDKMQRAGLMQRAAQIQGDQDIQRQHMQNEREKLAIMLGKADGPQEFLSLGRFTGKGLDPIAAALAGPDAANDDDAVKRYRAQAHAMVSEVANRILTQAKASGTPITRESAYAKGLDLVTQKIAKVNGNAAE